MNELIVRLSEFQHERTAHIKLEESFEKLALYLLFGGFFHCSKRYDLYITSVEFYYHEEEGNIKDPIVYHRNRHKWNKKLNQVVTETRPYFEVGTLNPHMSGVDITFEQPNKYRASALIRTFKVYDKIENIWLEEDERSTYVYDYLFDGLYVDCKLNQLHWINTDNVYTSNLKPPTRRKNVRQYVLKSNALMEGLDIEKLKVYDADFFKTNRPCDRLWRFSRIDSNY